MQRYEIVAKPIRLAAGTLMQLADDQVRRRRHAIECVDAAAGIWRSLAPVEFKVGERLGIEPAPPKALAAMVVEAEKAKAMRPAKNKAPA